MTTFWDSRYAEEGYAYGIEPNAFLKEELDQLKPGMILFPAEGQGRNCVYAASHGWNVTAFDNSEVGQKQALQLAKQFGVSIKYELCSYDEFDADPESFDCIALIFAHQPPLQRAIFHQRAIDWLKPGGHVILEAFAKQQLEKTSGGPRDLDMLFSREELESDFAALSEMDIRETEVVLGEGKYHIGPASVVRMVGSR
jgi:cyclopropane fatty-acyl-phospholipid synthase-like methyltransferase